MSEHDDIKDLIAQSSLGTPGAMAIRARTPPELAYAISRAVEEMARADAAEAERDRLAEELRWTENTLDNVRMGAAETAAEMDRLRAVVGDAVNVLSAEWLDYDEATQVLADMRAILDVSPTMGRTESTEGAAHESDADGLAISDRGAPDPPNGGPVPPSTPAPQPVTPDTGGDE